MRVETELAAVRGSCNRDRLSRSSFTLAPSVVLTNVLGSATLGSTPILQTLASLRGSTKLKVSTTLEAFSIFNEVFLESGCSTMVDFSLCFQKNT